MEILIVILFLVGYVLIAFEHVSHVNKTAVALVTGILCWVLLALSDPLPRVIESDHFQHFIQGNAYSQSGNPSGLFHAYVLDAFERHLGSIAQIVFFLLAAMTIVELVDVHGGFQLITDKIKTRNPKKLLWLLCWTTFFLSAVLDNLTSAIVMISVTQKLISNKGTRWIFAGMIIIAANAGGAWTPIGDVTTTMLWIGGQITAVNIMKTLFLPSVICILIPLLYLSITLQNKNVDATMDQPDAEPRRSGTIMLLLGIGVMVLVPVFKMLTGLPPYAGMLAGLGILWIVSEFINPEKDSELKKKYTPAGALGRIDVPTILFFFGILMAVGALESMQLLQHFSNYLATTIGNTKIIVALIGVASAVIDNVPLVAASMGMYDLANYPTDHVLWEYLAYCAGTGGSLLIIGSAAGVAVMGIEQIDFMWYLKRISLIALMGYIGGAASYLFLQSIR